MKTAEELAEWLDKVKYDYIAADYYEDSGPFFELDARSLAEAILNYLATEKQR